MTSLAVVGDPAVLPAGGFTVTAQEGAANSAQTVAKFTDPGGAEPNASDQQENDPYVATVDWGDGTTAIATLANGGIVLGPDGVTFSVVLSYTYGEEGTYTITVSGVGGGE